MKYLKDILLIVVIAAVAGVSIIFFINAREKYASGGDPSAEIRQKAPQGNITTAPQESFIFEGMPEEHIIALPYIPMEVTKTGGEFECAGMLVKNIGLEFNVGSFISEYVEMSPLMIDGTFCNGEDPKEYYIGDPRLEDGIGCCSEAVASACNEMFFKGAQRFIAKVENEHELTHLLEKYIINDIPVILWLTQGMEEPQEAIEWSHVEIDREYSWASNAQCMVLCGYDKENFRLYDPFNNNGLVLYEKSLVNKIWTELSSQALAVTSY